MSLLQPDVATLISRGDTLVYGLHSRDVAAAETLRRRLDDLRARWHALKSHMEVSTHCSTLRRLLLLYVGQNMTRLNVAVFLAFI